MKTVEQKLQARYRKACQRTIELGEQIQTLRGKPQRRTPAIVPGIYQQKHRGYSVEAWQTKQWSQVRLVLKDGSGRGITVSKYAFLESFTAVG